MRLLCPSRVYEGFEPTSPERNTEEGILDISSSSDCEIIEESRIIAESLILRFALRPIPLQDKTIKVHLVTDGKALDDALLYDENSITYGYEREVENSQWRGVALDYLGIGRGVHEGEPFVFYGKELPDGRIEGENPFFVKSFIVEEENHHERITNLKSGQILVSPPGVLNTRVLRGYGGYYKEGIDFADIQQIYYSLTSTDMKTRVRLFSAAVLREKLICPPQGGVDFNQNVLFSPPPIQQSYSSLSDVLLAGFFNIFVSHEWGQLKFSSFLVKPVFGQSTQIDVCFKPVSL